MKSTSLFALFIVFIMSTTIKAQWEILNEGGDFQTIDFINDQVGWIAGEKTLLKTEDGGQTWISVSMDSSWEFDKIDFVNENIGWAITIGNGRPIIKTMDGGKNWSVQKNFEIPWYSTFDLQAITDSIVYVFNRKEDGEPGNIYKTPDGGTNWIDVSPKLENRRIESIWFNNKDLGVASGSDNDRGIILKTKDGGTTWEESIISEFTTIYNLQLVNDSTAYFIAQEGFWPREQAYFYKTFDVLNFWSKAFLIYIIDLPISFFCLDEQTIFANERGKLMKSINGGETWEDMTTIVWGSDIYFKDNDIGFVLDRHLWKSNDGGRSWILQKFTYPLSDIYFFNSNEGIICGGNVWWHFGHDDTECLGDGTIFQTDNGGNLWYENFLLPTGRKLKSFCFINDVIGYALSHDCEDFYIYKTSDGGDNWTVVYENNADSTDYSFRVDDMNFINENKGWAVGWYNWSEDSSGAAFLGTSDCGNNWDLIWKFKSTDIYEYGLNSIYVVGKTAWAVGESGLIVKYTEQDQWQQISGVTDLPLRNVFFSDEQHGWITGGYFDEDNVYLRLFKTEDGGDNWEEKEIDYQINDMFFEDSLHGWAVGNDTSHCGMILESWDGGDNWDVQIDNLSAPLNALDFRDGIGWAVGDNGLVLRYRDPTWIEDDKDLIGIIPDKFELKQNYPNPFNPKTVISWQVGATGRSPVHVDLSIYNILGQKVATLVSGKQKAGLHQVEWDASGFASGIYYYIIKAGEFHDVKKMILIK